MKPFVPVVAIAVALAAGAMPVARAQDRTVGDRVDDATITGAVKAKLVAERASSAVAVDVDTRDGVVHLQVSSRSDTQRETSPAASPVTK